MKKVIEMIKQNKIATALIALLLLGGGVVFSGRAAAREIVLEKEVYLEHIPVPDAENIIATQDGGFLVAGGSGGKHQGWVAKTDFEGNVQWRYFSDLVDQFDFHAHGVNIFTSPVYHGAVAMPDGSFFLCGEMPRPIGRSTFRALLTHVDSVGKLIEQKLLQPLNDEKYLLGHFRGCKLANGNAVLYGMTSHLIAEDLPKGVRHSAEYYWLMEVGSDGNILWEKLIRSAFGGLSIYPSMLMLSNGELVLLYEDGCCNVEVVRTDAKGEVVARKVIKGNYTLVQSSGDGAGDQIQLISTRKNPLILLTLNRELEEVDRKTTDYDYGMLRAAYRLPDQSIILFGGKDIKGASKPRVIWLDHNLQNRDERLIEMSDLFSLWIDTATPAFDKESFVFVRKVIAKQKEKLGDSGLLLGFVKVK